jgi:5-methylcytosine-specific restriction endonuclease McrA
LCTQQIDMSLKYPNPMAPSIDHQVPIARGGSNDPSNLRATHWICNVRKRDRDAIESKDGQMKFAL